MGLIKTNLQIKNSKWNYILVRGAIIDSGADICGCNPNFAKKIGFFNFKTQKEKIETGNGIMITDVILTEVKIKGVEIPIKLGIFKISDSFIISHSILQKAGFKIDFKKHKIIKQLNYFRMAKHPVF